MANDLTRNPWLIDTAASLTTQLLRPARVRWTSLAGAAGDTLVIQDNPAASPANVAYGNTDPVPRTVLTMYLTGANADPVEKSFDFDMVWRGVKILTISSGVAEIEYR